ADADKVENLGGWLTTIVARLSLDRLRARAARPEDPAGFDLPEPIVTADDPEHQAMLADSIGLAMLIVLDTLTPAERLAFVLHDTFGLPFDEIAPIVDRTPAATRQLASRARRRVRGASASRPASPARQRELINAFIAASRAGDFEALLRILDPDVVVRSDNPAFGPREVRGAQAVASQALRFARLAPGARRALVNGRPGGLVFAGERPFAVVAIEVRGTRIVELDFITRPDRLARLDLSAVAPR
ncbi:MAG: RNA polymerase subunit sigma-70, partial [Chloroflexi bacterium]|nr:RNA polymerase subunit sigma-70 [Chloroflexota bacterium]